MSWSGIVRECLVGIETDCLIIVLDGTLIVTLAKVSVAPIVKSVGIVGIETNGLNTVQDSLVKLALVIIGGAAVAVRN